jgi:hypothetical protein
MLSSVLRSEVAIQVNIQIIRVFTRMKQLMLDNKDLWLRLEKIEKDLASKDQEIQMVFAALKKLLTPVPAKRKPLGFPYPGKK